MRRYEPWANTHTVAWLDGDDEGFFGQARNCAALEEPAHGGDEDEEDDADEEDRDDEDSKSDEEDEDEDDDDDDDDEEHKLVSDL